MKDLEDFFEQAQQEAEAYEGDLREHALHLLRNSTMRGDDDGLEEEIVWGDISPMRWREIFEQLKLNQLRVIDKHAWSKTEFNKSYKENGLDN
jgi:tRNA nucleotidyltransferase (CCA-adding enzyme)